MTVLVRLAYDGTDFHGFARQASGGVAAESGEARPLRTVPGEREAALAGLDRQPGRTRGASRADGLGTTGRGQSLGLCGEIRPREQHGDGRERGTKGSDHGVSPGGCAPGLVATRFGSS